MITEICVYIIPVLIFCSCLKSHLVADIITEEICLFSCFMLFGILPGGTAVVFSPGAAVVSPVAMKISIKSGLKLQRSKRSRHS